VLVSAEQPFDKLIERIDGRRDERRHERRESRPGGEARFLLESTGRGAARLFRHPVRSEGRIWTMDVLIAFVLGAGTVMAGKRGSRLFKDAIGWTARRTGYFSKQASIALDAARRMARQEFTRGRDSDPIVIDIDVDPGQAGHGGIQNGVPTNGTSASTTGTGR
jgi:hypothetical protein